MNNKLSPIEFSTSSADFDERVSSFDALIDIKMALKIKSSLYSFNEH